MSTKFKCHNSLILNGNRPDSLISESRRGRRTHSWTLKQCSNTAEVVTIENESQFLYPVPRIQITEFRISVRATEPTLFILVLIKYCAN
jgi:hypothetical protein